MNRGNKDKTITPLVLKEKVRMKLNIKAFALACGIIWGLGLFSLPGGSSPLTGLRGNLHSSAGCIVATQYLQPAA